jgi:hypothetical protein
MVLTVGTLAMGQAMVQHAAAAAGGAAAAAGSAKIAEGLAGVLGAAAGSAATAAAPVPVPAPAAQARHGKPSPFAAQRAANQGAPAVVPPAAVVNNAAVPSPAEVESMPTGEAARGNMWTPRYPARTAAVPFAPYVSGEAGPVMRGSVHRISGDPPRLAAVVSPALAALHEVIAVPSVPPPTPKIVATVEKLATIKEGETEQSVMAELGIPAAKIAMFDEGKLVESWRIESHGQKIGTVRMSDGVVTSVEPVAR